MGGSRPGEISARQAARRLGCHEKTLRAWCKSGRLETGRKDVVGHYWVSRSEIEALVKQADEDSRERVTRYREAKSG